MSKLLPLWPDIAIINLRQDFGRFWLIWSIIITWLGNCLVATLLLASRPLKQPVRNTSCNSRGRTGKLCFTSFHPSNYNISRPVKHGPRHTEPKRAKAQNFGLQVWRAEVSPDHLCCQAQASRSPPKPGPSRNEGFQAKPRPLQQAPLLQRPAPTRSGDYARCL